MKLERIRVAVEWATVACILLFIALGWVYVFYWFIRVALLAATKGYYFASVGIALLGLIFAGFCVREAITYFEPRKF